MTLILATRGEHIHVRKKGRLKESDPVEGFTLIGWEVEDEKVQETLVRYEGETISLEDFSREFPGKQIDVVGIPVFGRCCDLHRRGG